MKKTFTNYGECNDVHHRGKFMKVLFKYGALLALLLLTIQTFAQTANTVQGTVNDEKGQLMPGVTVKVKGTTIGTVTGTDGKFSIVADKGAKLTFSFIGYLEKEVEVGDQKNIRISLATTEASLNEVVVVGYGTQKRVSLTSAVTSVRSQEIVTTKNENVENMLTGKVAGLQVVQNTSEPGDFANNISIRGMGSPLFCNRWG